MHGQCHRTDRYVEATHSAETMDGHESADPHARTAPKEAVVSGGVLGQHNGSTCGETLHIIYHPLLVHASFSIISVTYHRKETLGAVGIRHASSMSSPIRRLGCPSGEPLNRFLAISR